jgi:hypothetical protein
MKLIKQIIGRVAYPFKYRLRRNSIDKTVTDYEWWDKFRRGKQEGYTYAGPLAQTFIETLTSYVFGKGVTFSLLSVDDSRMEKKVEYTNELLRKFGLAYQSDISLLYKDTLALGDQYAIVNADGSISWPTPDTIEPIYENSVENPFKVIGYKHSVYDDTFILEEEYYEDRRIRRVVIDGEETVQRFLNPRNVIPVVPCYFDKDRNETNGRPIFDSLLPLYADFDDLLRRSLESAQVTARPIPTFEGMEDINETIEALKTDETETYIDKDGNTQERDIINWDEDQIVFVGKGGSFKLATPEKGFTEDIERVLDISLSIVQNKMHLPDFTIPGGKVMTDKEAEAATPAFVRFLEALREEFAHRPEDSEISSETEYGLHRLVYVWLKTIAVFDKKVFVGPVEIHWNDLAQVVEQLQFEKVKWAHSRQMLRSSTALRLLSLVNDPELEVELAELENPVEVNEFDDFIGDDGGLSKDNTPDERKDNGADAPRMPASGGGGKVK